jgi:pre-rRNA-processing protein TSR2
MLLQVMGDEFDLLVEDGSEIVVARDIMKYRALCGNGEFGEVDRLYEMWRQNRNGAVSAGGNIRRSEVEGEDSEDDSGDDEDEDEDGDEDMGDVDMEGTEDAGPSRERHEPEVDEDGFTKVVGKKRR